MPPISKFLLVALPLLTFGAGISIGLNYKPGYFDLPFPNLIAIIVQITSASLIAYFINSVQSKNSRINNLKVTGFDQLWLYLKKLDADIIEYTNKRKPTEKLEREILEGFKLAQNELLLINDIHEISPIEKFDHTLIKQMLIDYKGAATSAGFKTKNPKVSSEQIVEINNCRRKINKHITEIRITNGN